MNQIIQQAREVIHGWIEALNDRRADAASNLYTEDALLLPTFSPRALSAPADRLDYFTSLTGRPELRVELHDSTLRFLRLPADVVTVSGIYRFLFAVDGEPLAFEARFTMVLCPADPNPIRHHHSSQVPRGLT